MKKKYYYWLISYGFTDNDTCIHIVCVFELRKINGFPTDNQVTISGCSSKSLVVRTWNKVNAVSPAVRFHSWDIEKFMVVRRTTTSTVLVIRWLFGCPGARTTKISNAGLHCYDRRSHSIHCYKWLRMQQNYYLSV